MQFHTTIVCNLLMKMSLNDINNLLKSYLDKSSVEDKEVVEDWLAENGVENDEWKHMDATARKQWLSDLYIDVQKSIQSKDRDEDIIKINPIFNVNVLKLVASIAAILVLIYGSYVTWPAFHAQVNTVSYKEVNVSSGMRKFLVLDDGTRIWLNSGSNLKYPSQFKGKKREVYLQGEAYFEVSHSDKIPFIVHTGKLKTKVLGTVFNITAYENDPDVKVALISGKVEVIKDISDKELGTLVLQPKQVASYQKNAENLVKKTTSEKGINRYSAWRDGKLMFDETPMSEVLNRLSLAYDVKFKLIDEKMNGCTITGSFNVDQGIEEIIQSISISIGAKVIRESNKITLIGKGCTN